MQIELLIKSYTGQPHYLAGFLFCATQSIILQAHQSVIASRVLGCIGLPNEVSLIASVAAFSPIHNRAPIIVWITLPFFAVA